MRRPRFIAEQARHARGPIGRVIAFIMARETWAQNRQAIDGLGIAPGDEVLDLGCGPGRALSELARRATSGRVVGADPSELMVEVASQRNRALVEAGRVDVTVGGVEALPFQTGQFDKVLCVHVLYFWPDLDAAFREIARVTKPGGRLALLFRSDADRGAVHSFPSEVYRFPAVSDVTAALRRAGFQPQPDGPTGAPVLLVAQK